MDYRVVADVQGQRTIVAVFAEGDEALAGLKEVAEAENLSSASVAAVGAFERATVGWYDLEAKEYRDIPVNEQVEVLSLLGDVARGQDGSVAVHVHAVLGLRDGTTRGGHLREGVVRPTLEVVLTESPAYLRKTPRPEYGLAVIDLAASS